MSSPVARRPWLAPIALLLAGAFLASACSHLSVRHLNRKPWVVNQRQSLETKFWRFAFESIPLEDGYGIRGVAYPLPEKLPPWATWAEELWFEAYLCDNQGTVIAKDIHVSLPRPLDPQRGVDVEFILKPEDLGSAGPLHVTFGYRLLASEGPPAGATPGSRPPFLAIERAMTRP